MQVHVDKERCIGAGMCALTAPGVFTQDDDGFSEILPGRADGGGDPLVREAVRACPVHAISTEPDGSPTDGSPTAGDSGRAPG